MNKKLDLSFLDEAIKTKLSHGPACTTLREFDSFDADEILLGYCDLSPNVPINKSKAYVHGWLNRQVNDGYLPISEAQMKLASRLIVREKRNKNKYGI